MLAQTRSPPPATRPAPATPPHATAHAHATVHRALTSARATSVRELAEPSHAFSIVCLKKNRRTGQLRLTVTLSAHTDYCLTDPAALLWSSMEYGLREPISETESERARRAPGPDGERRGRAGRPGRSPAPARSIQRRRTRTERQEIPCPPLETHLSAFDTEPKTARGPRHARQASGMGYPRHTKSCA